MEQAPHPLAISYPSKEQMLQLRSIYRGVTFGNMDDLLKLLKKSDIKVGSSAGRYLAALAAQNALFGEATVPITSHLAGMTPAASYKPIRDFTEQGLLILSSEERAVGADKKTSGLYIPTELGDVALGLLTL